MGLALVHFQIYWLLKENPNSDAVRVSYSRKQQTNKILCKIVYLWIIFYILKVSKEWSVILDKIRVESKVYFHCCIHHLSNVLCRPVNFSQFFHHCQFHIRPLCTGIYELEDCSLLGTIQVLHHQRGGWVGSENGNS